MKFLFFELTESIATIIAAVISAISGFTGGVLQNKKKMKTFKTENESLNASVGDLKEKQEEVLKELNEYRKHQTRVVSDSSLGFGYSLNKMEKSLTLDSEGNGLVLAKWLGINYNQNILNLNIPYEYQFFENGTKVGKPDVKKERNSEFDVIYRDSSGREYKNSNGEIIVKGNFIILGKGGEKTGFVGFKSATNIEKGFLMSAEEVQHVYGNDDWIYEFFISQVITTTGFLEVSVSYPFDISQMVTKPFPVSFLFGGNHLNRFETDRIKDMLTVESSRNKATLNVEDPIPGILYGISWMPPKTTIVNA